MADSKETLIEELIRNRKRLCLSDEMDGAIRNAIVEDSEPEYHRFAGNVTVCCILSVKGTYFLGSYCPNGSGESEEETCKRYSRQNAINNVLYYLQAEKTVSYDLNSEKNTYPNENPFRKGTVRVD